MPHCQPILLFGMIGHRNAGYLALPQLLSVEATRLIMLIVTGLFVGVSVLLFPFGVAGPLYLAVAVALGGAFRVLVIRGVVRREQRDWARQTFLFSLVSLAGLFAALLLSARAH